MLRKDKKGQGLLLTSVVGGAIVSLIVASATSWFLSMNQNMNGTNDRLEAMTIAMSEWQRLEHMSLEELEANRENYKTPYKVGKKFTVGVNLGEQGFFEDGECNSLTGKYSSESANCFKDTTMTVYDKDGKGLYTTRSLPLSTGGTSFPEGTILPYTGDLAKIPRGWVLCDGTNGTPDLRGRFLEGTGTTTGEFKTAGLPNITGYLGRDSRFIHGIMRSCGNGYASEGALYSQFINTSVHVQETSGEGTYNDMIGFYLDASRSNSIYGNSTTVQPNSYTVFYIMKTNKDFHYDHTNGFVSPEYYTKAEVDALLKEEEKKFAELNNNTKISLENNINSYYPKGTILPYAGLLSEIPNGWALCDGTNDTPDLTGRFLQGTKDEMGKYIEAGLPNITGGVYSISSTEGAREIGAKGAFKSDYYGRAQVSTADYGFSYHHGFSFDASLSSDIYGKSNTVQPFAYTVFYIMKMT